MGNVLLWLGEWNGCRERIAMEDQISPYVRLLPCVSVTKTQSNTPEDGLPVEKARNYHDSLQDSKQFSVRRRIGA